jgi:hypothetical protein
MTILRAAAKHIPLIRLRLSELKPPPNYTDEGISSLIKPRTSAAWVNPAQGHFCLIDVSLLDKRSTVIYLLPEEGGARDGLFRLLHAALLDAWERFPQARRWPISGIFRAGRDAQTGEEDRGRGKALAYQDTLRSTDLPLDGPTVVPILDNEGRVVAHRISWTLDEAKTRANLVLGVS